MNLCRNPWPNPCMILIHILKASKYIISPFINTTYLVTGNPDCCMESINFSDSPPPSLWGIYYILNFYPLAISCAIYRIVILGMVGYPYVTLLSRTPLIYTTTDCYKKTTSRSSFWTSWPIIPNSATIKF